jgi:CMP-N-acetylneuraminic acid synthetase
MSRPAAVAGPAARLAVIPARGGSKRLPRKNIRPMAGRPVIAYTIDAALDSGLFERVIVSTDSSEIAEIAEDCGAEVPFLRDPSLAGDGTPISEVTHDALARLDLDGSRFGQVAQLMANCPLRTAEDVRESHGQFLATGGHSQLSVTRYGWLNPWWAMRRAANMELEPLFAARATARSQDLPELYCPTGAIWWIRADTLRQAGTFHVPGRTGWEITWQRGVDIDTEDDWLIAEILMERQRREGGVHVS